MKISVEIRESKQGFIVQDGFTCEEVIVDTFDDAKKEVIKRLNQFKSERGF